MVGTAGSVLIREVSLIERFLSTRDRSHSPLLAVLQFGTWWAPMLVVTLLGVAFAIAFAVTGLVFCCCRYCGNCGGSRHQDKSKREGVIKICLAVVLGILIILIL